VFGMVGVASCSSSTPQPEVRGETTTTTGLEVRAISTRPEYVSGGDVLIEVRESGSAGGERGGSADAPVVAVAGTERPGVLTATTDGAWRGVVDELPDGDTSISARSGDRTGTLTVTNHPITGPLFSGPHQTPFACTTERFGLGAPTDANCSAPTRTTWQYVDANGTLRNLPADRSVPTDAATAEVAGRTVPLVVRTESGTINRGVYWISVLDPTPASEQWEGSSDGWNGDLVYRFGGGCGTSHSQGAPLVSARSGAPPTVDVDLLRRGYAVATDTLNTFQVHCNDVVSAETALMVEEHFSENYGTPVHRLGEGGSGGAIQQFLISQNYPGIIDAALIGAPFPDAMSMAPGVTDCGLLTNYYATPAGSDLTDDQRRAINGHASSDTCDSWVSTFLAVIDPTRGCDLPPDVIYDASERPEGVRCTLQDSAVNLFGVDPATGFAMRPLDNAGVQYGLTAIQSGAIDGEQFVALNERIGGYDIDGVVQPERNRAEADQIEHLARTGRVLQGAGDATRIPIIAVNTYSDPTGDIHDRWRIFAVRDRLNRAAGGDATGLSIWTAPGGNLMNSAMGGDSKLRNQALDAMATWLRALDANGSDTADADRLEVLRRTRPADASDRCVLPDGAGDLRGDDVYDAGSPCSEAYPLAGDPRRAAGQPLDGLVAKCQLRPVDPGEYSSALDAAQLDRLRAVFADGVCDWSKPGLGIAPVDGTWQRF
jgi:hypothetical protein